MDNKDFPDGDRKGKRPVNTSEFGEKPAWIRQTLENWQTTILKAAYKISKNPSKEALDKLACQTGLTHEQVVIWFNNKHYLSNRINEGESSQSVQPQLAATSEKLARYEPPQDVDRVVLMPMWSRGKLVRAGVLITYQKRQHPQSSAQQGSRVVQAHENQYAHRTGIRTDHNIGEDPGEAPCSLGDTEEEASENDCSDSDYSDSDSDSAIETD